MQEDVFNGATLYELMDNYTRHWMTPFQTLKYVSECEYMFFI
jgi:hypothetical protein